MAFIGRSQALYSSSINVMVLLVFLCGLLWLQGGQGSPWNSRNDPSPFASFLSGSLNMKLQTLPTSATLANVPWADSYWPSYLSGIAYRWARKESFQYGLHTLDELRNMSAAEIKTLSPAEKFDIYVGRYDYPTVKSEWERTSPEDPHWEGLCHGWSVASLQFKQPSSVVVKNVDNLEIPFAASDIKALISYFIAQYAEPMAPSDFVGERCKYDLQSHPDRENDTACADINAGSFHVILSNLLGAGKQGIVGDRERGVEVWNQPIFQFRSRLTGEERPPTIEAAVRAANEKQVETTVWYTLEQNPQYDAIETPQVGHKTLRYWLEMDNDGNVVGGSYTSWERMDFVWMEKSIVPFSGFFSSLQTLYNAATSSHSDPHNNNNNNNNNINSNDDNNHNNMHAVDEDENALAAATPSAIPYVPRRPSLYKILEAPVASFRASEVGHNYTNNFYGQWVIAPPGGATYIEIQFREFATERFHDVVKVYEGKEGKGALLGVYSGRNRPLSVLVRSSSALVVFITDGSHTDTGFLIRYLASYY